MHLEEPEVLATVQPAERLVQPTEVMAVEVGTVAQLQTVVTEGLE
jgi:hypothetical protein